MKNFFRPPLSQLTDAQTRTLLTLWRMLALTGLGCCVGVLALMFGATAYPKLPGGELFRSYFSRPLLVALNLLLPVLLIWLFYFLSRRGWVAFLGSFLPTIGLAMVNYFKIRLRSDPLLATDLRLAAEAGGIMGGYTLDVTWLVWFALACLAAGLVFSLVLVPKGSRGWKNRLFGAASCLALTAVAFAALFTNSELYEQTANNDLINQWSDVEVFASKGCVYPFLYSFREMFPTPPSGYNAQQAAEFLNSYEDTDIPEDKKVSVMGIMLEAFCDLTDFDALADSEAVAQIYAPWHALEENSVSGNLLTNIFAGGTVDSEWGFLTGYSTHSDFRKNTDSYVWYLKKQGYQTFGSHPGYGWFYNRQNVNQYLGFDEYWFTENHYGTLVDPVNAIYHSDQILVQDLLTQLEDRASDGPCFSFSVSYQNHGPYESEQPTDPELLVSADTGFSQETCNIFNHYLRGVSETIGAMLSLTEGLEAMDEPVVLVLFGDHKPWAGNGNTAYTDIGADFDLSTLAGFAEYYATPYVIWANSAAKAVLGNEFTGDGGDISPCFLMTELFDQCGWEGSGFMQLSRQMRQITPLVHVRNLYCQNGTLTDALPAEDTEFLNRFLCAQYYRETELVP
jgi:hypothetical protein